MSISPSFSARNWIASNCVGARGLYPETVDVVSNFTLMWNFFEGTLCNNRASVQTFETLAQGIAQHQPIRDRLEEAIRFWTSRYCAGSEFKPRFNDLRFRQNDRRGHVEAVLRGEKRDPASQLLAVLIIVYRLRNNLFHGLKKVDGLNDQADNLNMACRTLASVLEASEDRLIQRQAKPN
jgi:hypothetical protein